LDYPNSNDTQLIKKLAAQALDARREYIDAKLAATGKMLATDRPILALCGPSRCGKDTAAIWLSTQFKVPFVGSVSSVVAPLVSEVIGDTVEQVLLDRHDHRNFWFSFCNALRETDPTLLVRLTLADNGIISGIRAAIELQAAIEAKLIDLAVWIDRASYYGADTTVEYDADNCDVTIRNTTRVEFYRRLYRLGSAVYAYRI